MKRPDELYPLSEGNQCDGCCAGLPVNEYKNHTENGRAVQGCIAYIYDVHPFTAFEAALDRALGELLRADPQVIGPQIWSSLVNSDWMHNSGMTVGYTFRAAGSLIAAIRGYGDYMDWYCSGPYAVCSDAVREAMAREGWSWRAMAPYSD